MQPDIRALFLTKHLLSGPCTERGFLSLFESNQAKFKCIPMCGLSTGHVFYNDFKNDCSELWRSYAARTF